MTASTPALTHFLLLTLLFKDVLGNINLTDLVISDYDFNDPDNDQASTKYMYVNGIRKRFY